MLHTLLVAAAIVGGISAIAAFLIYSTRREARQRGQQLQDNFQALLALHNLRPDFTEVSTHRIMAVDMANQSFAFVQLAEENPSVVLRLEDVRDCKLWKDSVLIGPKKPAGGGRQEEYISAIGLSFSCKNGEVINVPVYAEIIDGIGEREALEKTADRWVQRLKALLPAAEKQTGKATA